MALAAASGTKINGGGDGWTESSVKLGYVVEGGDGKAGRHYFTLLQSVKRLVKQTVGLSFLFNVFLCGN